jgi:hypothetical protein
MVDARYNPSFHGLIDKLNIIVSTYGNDEAPVSFVHQETTQGNYFYQVMKFALRVLVNLRRLYLTYSHSGLVFNVLLSLSLYPIMALLLLHGLGANDLFLGICFLVFFPFMFVTVACAASMADMYRALIIDVEDGIYSALSLQTALMIYFIFSALVISVTSLGAIFVIRPMTQPFELYEALMIMNLDLIFFLGMIYFCVVTCAGDPGMVRASPTDPSFLTLSLALIGLSQCDDPPHLLYPLRRAAHQHLQVPLHRQMDPPGEPSLHLSSHSPVPLHRLLLSALWR